MNEAAALTADANTGAAPSRRVRPARAAALAAARLLLIVALLLLAIRVTGVMESIAFIHPGLKQFPTPRGVEDAWFTTSDGLKLHGWFMPARGLAPGERAPVVIHCHGNEASVDVHASWSDFLCARGISVLIFDYRGFGRSQDGPRFLRREHLMQDTRAALDYVLSRPDVDRERIGVYGVSLGGAFALGLAAERPEVRAIATVNTFCSWPSVASDYVPVLGRILIASGLAQADCVARLGSRPLLIVHADRDTIVPYRHAGVLMGAARAAGVNARLLTVEGADHLDVLDRRAGTTAAIADYFVQHLVGPEGGNPPMNTAP